MGSMRHQTALQRKLSDIVTQVETIYKQVGELVVSSCDNEEKYAPLLQQFLNLKSESRLDRLEGEGVVASVSRPIKQKEQGAAKKKSKAGVKAGSVAMKAE